MTELASVRPGDPWPGGIHGEVVSPSGQRAYLVQTAADLAGRTTRWGRGLAAGTRIASERGRMSGQQGGAVWFLHAKSFEAFGIDQGWWPPSVDAIPERGDADEAARLKALVRQLLSRLETVERERDRLLTMVRELTSMARRT